MFCLKRFLKSHCTFTARRKPNDHRLKRVDNNLISPIARVNDSHRSRGVSRQNERNANRPSVGWLNRPRSDNGGTNCFPDFYPTYYSARLLWSSLAIVIMFDEGRQSQVTRPLSAGCSNDAENAKWTRTDGESRRPLWRSWTHVAKRHVCTFILNGWPPACLFFYKSIA